MLVCKLLRSFYTRNLFLVKIKVANNLSSLLLCVDYFHIIFQKFMLEMLCRYKLAGGRRKMESVKIDIKKESRMMLPFSTLCDFYAAAAKCCSGAVICICLSERLT